MVHTRLLTLLLGLALLVTTAAAAWEGWRLYRDWRYDRQLRQLSDRSKPQDPRLQAALANRLAAQGRWQQAVQIDTRLLPHAGASLKPRLHYNLGTLYLQEAARRWNRAGVWDYAHVVTLLGLAREHLRAAVRLDPDDLDAAYNLEYALRIQPPPRERQPSKWRGHKQSVFATLPGMPKGGP